MYEAAVRAIEEMQIIQLSERDSLLFAEALLNPREPAERLRAAARRSMAFVETSEEACGNARQAHTRLPDVKQTPKALY